MNLYISLLKLCRGNKLFVGEALSGWVFFLFCVFFLLKSVININTKLNCSFVVEIGLLSERHREVALVCCFTVFAEINDKNNYLLD